MMKESIHQEDIAVLNIMPQTRQPQNTGSKNLRVEKRKRHIHN